MNRRAFLKYANLAGLAVGLPTASVFGVAESAKAAASCGLLPTHPSRALVSAEFRIWPAGRVCTQAIAARGSSLAHAPATDCAAALRCAAGNCMDCAAAARGSVAAHALKMSPHALCTWLAGRVFASANAAGGSFDASGPIKDTSA